MIEKYQNFLNSYFVVFDVETSGLDPCRDDILEIAAIRLKGREEVGRFEALIQPKKAISPEVEKIHGLNEIYLLVNGRQAEEVIGDFLKFVGPAIVVGHNIKEFDWLFILNQLKKMSLASPIEKFIDTLELARQVVNLPNYTLGNVAKHFGLEHRNAHRAMPDVEVNAQVFIKLMEKLLNEEK